MKNALNFADTARVIGIQQGRCRWTMNTGQTLNSCPIARTKDP